jgi:GNAT superfamily N-acetyltransferase
MYVQQPWRSQDVGRQFAEACIQWATHQGAQRMSVTTYATNTRAITFYQAFGFEPQSLSLEMDIP